MRDKIVPIPNFIQDIGNSYDKEWNSNKIRKILND